jgi:hypothetical protein
MIFKFKLTHSFIRPTLIAVICVGLVACKAEKNSTPARAVPAPTPNTEIAGNWTTVCAQGEFLGNGAGASSLQYKMAFSATTYTYIQLFFSDANCTSLSVIMLESGVYSVLGTNSQLNTVQNINLVQYLKTITTYTDATTNTFNTFGNNGGSYCNGIIFVKNNQTDIAGAGCTTNGGNPIAQTSNGAKLLNIYSYSASSTPNSLQFGDTQNTDDYMGVSVSGTRPSTIVDPGGRNPVFTRE